jgi:hypothetical protein
MHDAEVSQVISVILWKECGNQKISIISLQYFLLIFVPRGNYA